MRTDKNLRTLGVLIVGLLAILWGGTLVMRISSLGYGMSKQDWVSLDTASTMLADNPELDTYAIPRATLIGLTQYARSFTQREDRLTPLMIQLFLLCSAWVLVWALLLRRALLRKGTPRGFAEPADERRPV